MTPITTTTYTIVGGAAGWIDTALTSGTGQYRVHVFVQKGADDQAAGVRPHGSAIECAATAAYKTCFLSEADDDGHVDFYRAAANKDYYHIGYLEYV